jgi:maltodextrin utilization protein YvdJ
MKSIRPMTDQQVTTLTNHTQIQVEQDKLNSKRSEITQKRQAYTTEIACL